MKNLELIEKLSNLNKIFMEAEEEHRVIAWGDYNVHLHTLSDLLKISDENIKIVDRGDFYHPYAFTLEIDDIVYFCLGDESTVDEFSKYMECKSKGNL